MGETEITPQNVELFLEYRYVRIYCNSIGMQAVCERAFADTVPEAPVHESVLSSLDDAETRPVQEVILDSCALLERAVAMAESNMLRLCPVRVFLRLTTASMFLIKALGIGVRNSQLRHALGLLDAVVAGLRSEAPDDMHLASRYADLLETHVGQLRTNFSSHLRQTITGRTRAISAGDGISDGTEMDADGQPSPPPSAPFGQQEQLGLAPELDSIFDGLSTDDMLSLPFDPVMAPLFPVGGSLGMDATGVDGGDGMALLWNFPGR